MSTTTKWRIVQIVFTVSGACGLSYEIIWGRWLATILGSSAIATCIVLATFMGGLATGSWFFGRICPRISSPLTVYVGVELFIGVTAAILPLITSQALGVSYSLRIAFVVVSLLIPTFLMGGTVPVMLSWTETMNLPPGGTLSRLYGLNTLGACLGCLAAGFWLIPTLGLHVTNGLAASLNVTIALIIFLIRGHYRTLKRPVTTPPKSEDTLDIPAWTLHYVVFISGLTTLGLEVIWIRLLRITLGSTTYTFTIVIATFILGIGVGGLLAGRIKEELAVEVKLAHMQWLLTAFILVQFLILPVTPKLYPLVRQGSDPWLGALIGSAVVCFISLLPVTFLLGYMFPLIGRFYMRRGNRGSEVGIMYAINTVGAVLGAILTTVAFIPGFGSPGSYLLFIGLMMTSLGIYSWLARRFCTRFFYSAVVALSISLAVIAFYQPGWSPDYLGRGAFTGKVSVLNQLFFREGRNSTVFVEKFASGQGMRVDGKPVASTVFIDRVNQILLGHLPAMLTPKVRSGLVIGLGTGMTLDSLAQHQLERLEVVELEKAVVQGARTFETFNNAVLDRPELVVILDDGFNYLHATESQYDVITSDPIQPYFRGAATLYSTEYFERAKQRLAPEGVMAHWLPLAQMNRDDFKMIVRSFTDVFPYSRLYWTGGLFDTILVGRKSPWIAIDPEQFKRAGDNLQIVHIESLEEVENLLIADRSILTQWAGDGNRNTIDLPILEFTSPRSLFVDTGRENMNELIAMKQAMNRNSAGWYAITALLAYQTRVATIRDDELSQHVLWNWLDCNPTQENCSAINSSGLLRYQIWEIALRQGERALKRYLTARAFDRLSKRSGSEASTDVFLKEQINTSLAAYELAHRLTIRNEEKASLQHQLRELQHHVPADSSEGLRLQAIFASL